MIVRWTQSFAVAACGWLAVSAAPAQEVKLSIGSLFDDFTIVEREEAAAKEIRLKWITTERDRIHQELAKYENELRELREMMPDPVKPRTLSAREDRNRKRDEIAFNDWASNNTPERRYAMVRGAGLNALLKVLGPIAHCRKQRGSSNSDKFPSLAPSATIQLEEVSHYRINPATSSGSRVEFRLNRLPLEIEWPGILREHWRSDCDSIDRLRGYYVSLLTSDPKSADERRSRFKDFDAGCSVLQAKAINKKGKITEIPNLGERREVFLELQGAIRYLEQLRVTAKRFNEAPSDYKVRSFPGGNVEDFIDFCYMHSMLFQPATPEDEEAYVTLSRRMQDYARDIQYIEDWKGDLEARINELQSTDKELVWRASEK